MNTARASPRFHPSDHHRVKAKHNMQGCVTRAFKSQAAMPFQADPVRQNCTQCPFALCQG